jgi:uncharacterized protein
MNASIIDFINEQKVASVCCLDENGLPHCFSCFFAFNSGNGLLYFKSQSSSEHSRMLLKRLDVAGTILPDKLKVIALKGVQFKGTVLDFSDTLCNNASSHYHKKYPFALAKSGEVWTIKLDFIKMTDNTKGFGTKIIWERNEVVPHHTLSNE